MATAKSNVTRVEVHGDVTLTLSPMEAIFLTSLLSETNGNSSSENDPETFSMSIFLALDKAGVPSSQEYVVEDGTIEFDDDAMAGIRAAMCEWRTC